jgi:hypothetical protein
MEEKPSKWYRFRWTALGAIGAGILAIGVNVASEQINSRLEVTPESAPECEVVEWGRQVDSQQIEIAVREDADHCWRWSLDRTRPGDTFEVLAWWRNFTDSQVNDVTLEAYLPDGFSLVPGTTTLINSNNPDGMKISDNVVGAGVNVGSYLHGANAVVMFQVRMSPQMTAPCQLTVYPISIRARLAPEPDNAWKSAAVVLPADC